jgi:hypothetical protein
MSAPVEFSEVAAPLHRNGYTVIPIAPKGFTWRDSKGIKRVAEGKGPTKGGWQNYGVGQTDADLAGVLRWRRGKAGTWGTGILTAHLPAVDIDVRDEAAAREIVALAHTILGPAPQRFGSAPKVLLPYRTDKPFAKILSREFHMPGDEDGDKPHMIEILADGQQFVAYAIHPDTRAPYRWENGEPLDIPVADLTVVTREAVEAFVKEAEAVLLRHGARPATLAPKSNGMGTAAHADLPVGAPPCLHTLATIGFGDWQNSGAFNLAVLRKKSDPDNWQELLRGDNERLKLDLEKGPLERVIASVGKKDYGYKCREKPICEVCDKTVCRTREFGIGRHLDPDGPTYQVIDGALAYVKHEQHGVVVLKLANFAAHIDEDVTVDDGAVETRRFRLSGALDTGAALATIDLPTRQLSGPGWVVEHWGARAIIAPGYGATHLAAAIQTVSTDAATRRVFAHTGWRQIEGRWSYLHGGGAIGADGPVEGIEVDLGGELAGFVLPAVINPVRAVRAALDLLDLDTLIAATVWRAPLVEFCPVAFSTFVAGATGTFKSALTGVAQAHWGTGWDGVRFPANWSGTMNSIEKLAFLAKDAMLVVDDFAPSASARAKAELHEKAERLLRGAGNLAGRSRMAADTSLRPTYWPRGIIAGSGEDVPGGHSLRARMAIEQLAPKSINPAKLSTLQAAAAGGLLAEAMASFVRRMAELADADVDGLRDRLHRRQIQLRAEISAAHRRTPDTAAALTVGIEEFLRFAVEVGAIDEAERKRRLAIGWQKLCGGATAQGDELREDDPVTMFVEAIPTLLAAGRAHVSGRDGEVPQDGDDPNVLGWRRRVSTLHEAHGCYTEVESTHQPLGDRIGWVEGGALWLLPDETIAAVNRMLREQGRGIPVSQRTLGRRLREAGWLVDFTEGSNCKSVKVSGSAHRVFAMERGRVLEGASSAALVTKESVSGA